MAKRKKRDFTQVALGIVEKLTGGKLTGGELPAEPPADSKPDNRNPAAVALSKLGASKGGKARAKGLSAKRRSEIAKRAAKARWGKRRAR